MKRKRLFVDDVRTCPEGWLSARTVTSAIRFLATFDIEEVSLDHDIGCRLVTGQEHSSEETFEPVARYLAAMRRAWKLETILKYRPSEAAITASEAWPSAMAEETWPLKVRIHTANFEAGKKMAAIIGIPYTSCGFDPKDYKLEPEEKKTASRRPRSVTEDQKRREPSE